MNHCKIQTFQDHSVSYILLAIFSYISRPIKPHVIVNTYNLVHIVTPINLNLCTAGKLTDKCQLQTHFNFANQAQCLVDFPVTIEWPTTNCLQPFHISYYFLIIQDHVHVPLISGSIYYRYYLHALCICTFMHLVSIISRPTCTP